MPSTLFSETADADASPVGLFTGFGTFARKELLDWWKSWRLIIVFAIPTLILTLAVIFGFDEMRRHGELAGAANLTVAEFEELAATLLVLMLFQGPMPGLFILIIVFSCMGLLTTEKTTGTLAWVVTKPLGRTGLFAGKWFAATLVLWLAMCVAPVLISSLCMKLANGVSPNFSMIAPIVGAAFAWIGLWVLLVLTISLGFYSTAAVGGIAIIFWIVPVFLRLLLVFVLGEEKSTWIMDRMASQSPFLAYQIFADKKLLQFTRDHGDGETWKTVWVYAYAVWMIVLGAFSLRIFNRQEIGS